MRAWLYILKCADDSYYVGSTKDLERRINEHKMGHCVHTSQRLPIELVYSEVYKGISHAKKREMQVKHWTRNKKEALINRNIRELHELAVCRNETHYENKP
jgi:putative endonuclease